MRRKPTRFTSWAGDAYRATTYDVPLWVDANRRDGRFGRADERPTQYLSLDPEAPFAEFLRSQELRSDAEAGQFRATLWMLRVQESAIVDYGTFERAEAAGFPAEALVDDDHERCQAEATRLVGLGARGLVTPSAALPGSVNLTLFGPRVAVAWDTPRRLASQLPARRLQKSPPPEGLTRRVRYFGEPHVGLLSYLNDRSR